MVKRLGTLLESADEREAALTFIVVVGANEGSRSGNAALANLRASKFLRGTVESKRTTHRYFDGNQHTSQESLVSPCDTAVFLLQSRKGHERDMSVPEKIQVIKNSFLV